MTDTRPVQVIRAELTATTLEWNKAREDVQLFERLTAAASTAAQLEKRDTELRNELLKAEAAADRARKEAAYANIRNMRVAERRGSMDTGSALSATYLVSFETLAWNSSTRRSEWVAREVNGFAALTPDQMGYLLDVATDAIPNAIMNLAPSNAREAFRIYSLGLRRGYLGR